MRVGAHSNDLILSRNIRPVYFKVSHLAFHRAGTRRNMPPPLLLKFPARIDGQTGRARRPRMNSSSKPLIISSQSPVHLQTFASVQTLRIRQILHTTSG
jgi:hypothetical protein